MDRVDLSKDERLDLAAFLRLGWRFVARTEPELDWVAVRAANPGRHLFAGLLARRHPGGLVVLRDRVLLPLAGHAKAALLREKLVPNWECGDDWIEMQVALPDRGLQRAIDHELEELKGTYGIFAQPSLLYRVAHNLGKYDPLDPFDPWQWKQIRVEKAWALAGSLGAGTLSAIIDMGFYFPKELLWC